MTAIQFLIRYKSENYLRNIREALESGCKWIQLQVNDNENNDEAIKAVADIKAMCRKHEAMIIVEGCNSLAQKAEVDGVFNDSANPEEIRDARKSLGEGYIIGVFANNYSSISAAQKSGADYVCVGPFGKSSEALNAEDYQNITTQLHENGQSIPVVAFGEIAVEDETFLVASGIDGVALNAETNCKNGIKETLESFLNC